MEIPNPTLSTSETIELCSLFLFTRIKEEHHQMLRQRVLDNLRNPHDVLELKNTNIDLMMMMS